MSAIKEPLAYIERNEAWLTHASSLAGTDRQWRCQVSERHFASPDRRERIGGDGYGRTALEAIEACRRNQEGR